MAALAFPRAAVAVSRQSWGRRCLAGSPCHRTQRPLSGDEGGLLPAASSHLPEESGGAFSEPDGLQDLFLCEGIEGQARLMRRRVQLGMGLEFGAVQIVNFYNLAQTGADGFYTNFIENSNALVAFHIVVVWGYHAFLRDALLARHVTRVATAAEGTGLAVLVEMGPWRRSLRLAPSDSSQMKAEELLERTGPESDLAVPGDQKSGEQPPLSFGQLLKTGVLHVDTKCGEVLQARELEALLASDLVVVKEEVTTDVPLAVQAFVDPNRMVPFLEDASQEPTMRRLAETPPGWFRSQLLDLRGSSVFNAFGLAALAMGIGSFPLFLRNQFRGDSYGISSGWAPLQGTS